MKDKIMLFVIGVLIGAVISTGAFYIYTTTNSKCEQNNSQMNNGTPPEMPSSQNSKMGEPPEKPDGTKDDSSQNQNNDNQNNNG